MVIPLADAYYLNRRNVPQCAATNRTLPKHVAAERVRVLSPAVAARDGVPFGTAWAPEGAAQAPHGAAQAPKATEPPPAPPEAPHGAPTAAVEPLPDYAPKVAPPANDNGEAEPAPNMSAEPGDVGADPSPPPFDGPTVEREPAPEAPALAGDIDLAEVAFLVSMAAPILVRVAARGTSPIPLAEAEEANIARATKRVLDKRFPAFEQDADLAMLAMAIGAAMLPRWKVATAELDAAASRGDTDDRRAA